MSVPDFSDHFILPDASGDLWIWRRSVDYSVPIISKRALRNPELWGALVALIEGAS